LLLKVGFFNLANNSCPMPYKKDVGAFYEWKSIL
jgi:hypothetical protein